MGRGGPGWGTEDKKCWVFEGRREGNGQNKRKNSRRYDVFAALLTLKFLLQGEAKESKKICDHEANA